MEESKRGSTTKVWRRAAFGHEATFVVATSDVRSGLPSSKGMSTWSMRGLISPSDRLGSSPPRPAALFIRFGDAQGARAVGERQAFNAKTPVCQSIVRVDIAAFMLEMQLAFPQELQRWLPVWARTFTGPPVQERRGDFASSMLDFPQRAEREVSPKHLAAVAR